MKKNNWLIIALLGVILGVASSCSKTETYADKLKKESKTINSFIDKHKIKVLRTYPANGVFQNNEFFLDPQSGVYFQVVDSGNGQRANSDKRTQIVMRFKDALRIGTSDTTKYTNMDQNGIFDYMDLTFGLSSTYTNANTSAGSNYSFKSPGCVVPLAYVGDSAVVKMIIPFVTGSSLQLLTSEPIYFDYLIYSFQD